MYVRFLVVSVTPARFERARKILPGAELFEGDDGSIPDTYRRLAIEAVEEDFDSDTLVLQDDVWLPHGPGFEGYHREFWNPLVVYGTRRGDGHTCPKAFTATPPVWKQLAQVWDGDGRICPAWQPIVEEHGIVLNVIKDMGGASAPCRGCGH